MILLTPRKCLNYYKKVTYRKIYNNGFILIIVDEQSYLKDEREEKEYKRHLLEAILVASITESSSRPNNQRIHPKRNRERYDRVYRRTLWKEGLSKS